MAYTANVQALPKKAASTIGAHLAVANHTSAADQVIAGATSMGASQFPLGVTIATAASPGNPLAVQVHGVAKALAAASLGHGVLVKVASSNGALGPVASSGGAIHTVGVAQEAAAAGAIFSVLLRPVTGAGQ